MIILWALDYQPVRYPVMRAVVLAVARVVALPDLAQDTSQDLPAVILEVGSGMDDNHVEIGLLVPSAAGPGTEEDDGLGVGLCRQGPAEVDCGRVGTRVGDGCHLTSDAVSSHRRHRVVSSRESKVLNRRCGRTECRM